MQKKVKYQKQSDTYGIVHSFGKKCALELEQLKVGTNVMLLKEFIVVNLLLTVHIIATFSNNATGTQSILLGKSILTTSAVLPNAFLKRKKRFLIFEEGASAVATVNMGKAIVGTTPRGLVYVNEYSLYYELPYDIEMILLHKLRSKPTKTTTTTQAPIIPWHYEFDNWKLKPSHDNNFYLPQVAKKWQNFQYSPPKSKWQNWHKMHAVRQHSIPKWQQKTDNINRKIAAKTICLRRNIFGLEATQRRQGKWCKSAMKNIPRSKVATQHRQQRSTAFAKAENMLFDLIELWAKIHAFNGRYCAMRTLCEARQLLLPKGQSLFHDILHILINFSTPRLQQDEKLRRSFLLHENTAACANLYGPHCRLSFLQHFTRQIHGKFM